MVYYPPVQLSTLFLILSGFGGWSKRKGEVVFLTLIQQSNVEVLLSWLLRVVNIEQHQ